jgi:hypothetical protein
MTVKSTIFLDVIPFILVEISKVCWRNILLSSSVSKREPSNQEAERFANKTHVGFITGYPAALAL